MDTKDNRPTVALTGVCARVKLPIPPNFLQPVTGGDGIPIAALGREDVLALGLALHRALVNHWAERVAKAERLTPREAENIGADLVHPAIVERLAMAEAGREGCSWGQLSREERRYRVDKLTTTLHDFALELTRHD